MLHRWQQVFAPRILTGAWTEEELPFDDKKMMIDSNYCEECFCVRW